MKQQGFTLIELLITVVILGILTGLAAPQMGQYLVQERVRGALTNLKQELGFARSEAIKRNLTIYVTSQEGGNWCVGISTEEDCDCSQTDPEQADACILPVDGTRVLRRLSSDDYPGVTLGDAFDFEFDAVRGVSNNNDTFTLSAEEFAGGVKVSRIGRVRACGNISGMEGC